MKSPPDLGSIQAQYEHGSSWLVFIFGNCVSSTCNRLGNCTVPVKLQSILVDKTSILEMRADPDYQSARSRVQSGGRSYTPRLAIDVQNRGSDSVDVRPLGAVVWGLWDKLSADDRLSQCSPRWSSGRSSPRRDDRDDRNDEAVGYLGAVRRVQDAGETRVERLVQTERADRRDGERREHEQRCEYAVDQVDTISRRTAAETVFCGTLSAMWCYPHETFRNQVIWVTLEQRR
ncbi:hypothetical protein SAMN04489841_2883 [Natrinema salaciae]|uniref:Uncharacterized protein n=1 Tax=Natrinema salaciae TaxID=1186196 RepID=A0A1H9KCS5_9EURY|nr:hypothetical protein SAMN04489841_2883 [Natrinema salaciae]